MITVRVVAEVLAVWLAASVLVLLLGRRAGRLLRRRTALRLGADDPATRP
ncbi:hypothetical protein ACWCPD_16100 [Streptomyces sp. NPDC001935]